MKFTSVFSSRAGVVVSVVIAFALVAARPYAAFAQMNPLAVGTWKLNLARSKYDPGPPPMSQTLTYERSGDGQKLTNQTVGADGTRTTQGYKANHDGKDYPRTGSGYADTIALRRIDLYTVEETLKRADRVVTTVRQVVSKDGKVMTFTVTGANASGQPIHNVLVYDKQQR